MVELKKVVIWAGACILLLLFLLNSSFLANQAVAWVRVHPKDPSAPEVLYRSARWCDWMGDNDKAIEIYWLLYQEYPQRGDLAAPALYYIADIMVSGSNILGIKKQAIPVLEKIMSEYPTQGDWSTKAKQLFDEVNYAR